MMSGRERERERERENVKGCVEFANALSIVWSLMQCVRECVPSSIAICLSFEFCIQNVSELIWLLYYAARVTSFLLSGLAIFVLIYSFISYITTFA